MFSLQQRVCFARGRVKRRTNTIACFILQVKHEGPPREPLAKRPEVIDDLVRNFLVRMKMFRTLETFETEWFILFTNFTFEF